MTMQIDGWDIPVSASNYYRSKWHHILGKQPYKTLPEWIAFAEKLAGKYGGVLPSGGRLQKFQDGYALYQCMKTYPMAFSHIPQQPSKSEYYTEAHWITRAEKIANDHGGRLPNNLQKLDSYLYAKMRTNPELFSHIHKDAKERKTTRRGFSRKTPDEWRRVADNLAGEHGGNLPGRRQLEDMGYEGLYSCMRNHPGKFNGLRFVIHTRRGQATVKTIGG